jgi:hypothetical protein
MTFVATPLIYGKARREDSKKLPAADRARRRHWLASPWFKVFAVPGRRQRAWAPSPAHLFLSAKLRRQKNMGLPGAAQTP